MSCDRSFWRAASRDSRHCELAWTSCACADRRERLPRVRVPTLVIAGEYDRMTPPGQLARSLLRFPGARLELISRAGHAPFLSHAGEFCQAVTTFLGQAAREAGS